MTKTIAYIVGAVTAIAGLWGFAASPVLGVFDANTMLSLAWLVTGLIILAVAMWWEEQTSMTLIVLGVIYAIIAVVGLVVSGDVLGMFNNTSADNWLHVVLAVVMLVAGFMGRGSSSMPQGMGGM